MAIRPILLSTITDAIEFHDPLAWRLGTEEEWMGTFSGDDSEAAEAYFAKMRAIEKKCELILDDKIQFFAHDDSDCHVFFGNEQSGLYIMASAIGEALNDGASLSLIN